MAPPFDMSWTPELENKLSTQIDGQLPDFIAEDHPQFSKFLKSYYQFLESGELQLTVDIDNILLEVQTPTNLLLEDGTLIVTESGVGSTGKFEVGETITGGTSYATAKVLVDDLSNATPKIFISAQQLFETGETVTGGTSGAIGVITKYRANPVQNIQQLLANTNIDNTLYDFIEEFRKSFMAGIPANIANGINRRDLEKHIGDLYRRKGTSEGFKLFIKILLNESAEIFYPNQYMMKSSSGDWDKPTVIRVSSPDDIDADELVGQSITGESSLATALVESSTTFSLSGGTSYIEFEISSVIGTFENGETAYGISAKDDIQFNFIIDQLLASTSISNDGTLYVVDDVIDLDDSVAIGSGDISAVVGTVERGSVSDVIIDSGGTNYEIGELVVFADNSSEDIKARDAAGVVSVVHGLLIDETSDHNNNTIVQEAGTNTFIELFNFQLEEGTLIDEEPFVVFGTDRIYSAGAGYYYPIYITNYAAEQSNILKSSASVNGATFSSTTVTLDGNAGDDIAIGMVVRSNSIDQGRIVTVTSVTNQSTILLSIPQTLLDNEVLAFDSLADPVRIYNFVEYPGVNFYSPTATTVSSAGALPSADDYTLYGGDFNHQSDHLYYESGNVASYAFYTAASSAPNTELELGRRIESEWAVNTISLDTNRYADEGFALEAGDGSITKISVTDPGFGYSLLPTVTVRTRLGNGANVLATTTDIGRISSVNVSNPGFSYTESPTSEARANFIIKDITGVFAVGDTLTSHTGSVRSYDSTTQLLEVSIEDTIAIEGESKNVTSNEGMRLEPANDFLHRISLESSGDGLLLEETDGDNIFMEVEILTNPYLGDNLILDADIVYGENLVDENGDRLLIDNLMTSTISIFLEDDEGQLIMEFPEERLSFFDLEDGTMTPDGLGNGFIVTENETSFIILELETPSNLINEDDTLILAESGHDIAASEHFSVRTILESETTKLLSASRQIKFILESSPIPALTDGGGAFIVLDADLDHEEDLVLNQTNLSATILLEDPDPDLGIILLEDDTPDAGAAEGNDAIILDGTDASSTDADEKLLLELFVSVSEIFYGKDAIILDSTDANGADENDKLFFEDGITGPANIGEKIIFNATDGNGTNDPTNLIVLESGLGVDANNTLLYENDVAFTNLVLDGTNTDSLHETEKILFEDAGFDFSGKTTFPDTESINSLITTATASARIAHSDIAKLAFSLGTSTEKFGKFSGIEHFISEALIRLQDSYYYQDFSYEVQTNSSGDIYLNELRKAAHPAGFNVFSKVLSVSFVSAKAKVAAKPSEEGTIVFRFNNVTRTFDDISRAADYYTYTFDAPRVRHP
jgi:hypothetical protein